MATVRKVVRPKNVESEEEEEEIVPEIVDGDDIPMYPEWAGGEKIKAQVGGFADFFTPVPEPQIIKFLQSAPFINYAQHWVQREGKKSFVCLGVAKCPLCDIGDKARMRSSFNILVLGESPQVKVWEIGRREYDRLKNLAAQPRSGPLDKPNLYWAVSRTGTKTNTAYQIDSVKERDLEDEWSLKPVTETELGKFRLKCSASGPRATTKAELEDIAQELLDA